MADATVPGFSADPSLEAKLAGLDDSLQPLVPEDTKEEVVEDDVVEDEATEDEEDKEESEEVDGEADDKEEATEDEGYTIDGEDSEDEPADEPVQTPDGVKPSSQLTAEQQYILDNISPITVRGVVGTDDKVQTFNVLDPAQLPAGFKYIDDREMAIAVKSFAMLETQAERLQSDFRTQSTKQAADDFKKREDDADRADIGRLQREGDLPKFKAAPNSKDFDTDPASVLIQEVLDYKESTNARYMDEYNAGRPYKHIGFDEALRLYKRENPSVNAEQQAEDEARTKIAKRTARTKGASEQVKEKPRVHSGMSSRDIDNLIDGLDW